MSTTYSWAGEVEKVAHHLIPQHHPHLQTAPIAYLFRDPPAKRGGTVTMGSARLVRGLPAFLARTPVAMESDTLDGIDLYGRPFFVLEVASTMWAALSDSQRSALVDHELCHMRGVGEDLEIAPHDLEEFTAVIRRHGPWTIAAFDLIAAGADAIASLDVESLRIELDGDDQE